jgi:hypothetical protein
MPRYDDNEIQKWLDEADRTDELTPQEIVDRATNTHRKN